MAGRCTFKVRLGQDTPRGIGAARDCIEIVNVSLAKTTSGSFGGDPSQETARAGGLRLSALPRVDGSRVSGGRKSEGRTVLVCGARIRGVGRGLCGATDVSMMEATDLAKRHDAARLGPFDGPHVWRVLVEREMSPYTVIVREVRGESAT